MMKAAQANDDMAYDLALVISDLGPGGAQRVAATLLNAWAGEGRRPLLITLAGDAGAPSHFRIDDRVGRRSLAMLGRSGGALQAISANLRRISGLRREVRRSGAPVVLSFIGTTNIVTVLASLGLGRRIVISERNDPSRQSLGRAWDWLRRHVYRRADLVTANSRNALATMAAYVPQDKLAFLPNPLAVSAPATDRATTQEPVILAVGKLTRQKAHDISLRAFAQLAPRHPQWRLRVAGDGPLREELRQQADDLGIAGRVDWLGSVDDVTTCFALASIFILPSRFEGTPNALLEAMAAELPVVTSDTCEGGLEFVEDGVSGLVVPAEDPAALAAALERLIGDRELRARLARNGRARVSAFSVDRVVAQWNDVLRLAPQG